MLRERGKEREREGGSRQKRVYRER